MSRTRWLVVAVLSLLPPIVFVVAALFEPWFYGLGWGKVEIAEVGDMLRIGSAILVLAMIVYFASYLRRSEAPSLQGKKSLWTWILILGNVFAVPVFWYVFFWRTRKVAN